MWFALAPSNNNKIMTVDRISQNYQSHLNLAKLDFIYFYSQLAQISINSLNFQSNLTIF